MDERWEYPLGSGKPAGLALAWNAHVYALATDPENAVFSHWSARWIIDDIVPTSLEVDLIG